MHIQIEAVKFTTRHTTTDPDDQLYFEQQVSEIHRLLKKMDFRIKEFQFKLEQ